MKTLFEFPGKFITFLIEFVKLVFDILAIVVHFLYAVTMATLYHFFPKLAPEFCFSKVEETDESPGDYRLYLKRGEVQTRLFALRANIEIRPYHAGAITEEMMRCVEKYSAWATKELERGAILGMEVVKKRS